MSWKWRLRRERLCLLDREVTAFVTTRLCVNAYFRENSMSAQAL